MPTKLERGFTWRSGHEYAPPPGYALMEDGDAPYRWVWLNRQARSILTYCEGDLIREACDTDAELEEAIARCRAFYGPLAIDAPVYTVQLLTAGEWVAQTPPHDELVPACRWAEYAAHRHRLPAQVLNARGKVVGMAGTQYRREQERTG
jgi:hypothetical protein